MNWSNINLRYPFGFEILYELFIETDSLVKYGLTGPLAISIDCDSNYLHDVFKSKFQQSIVSLRWNFVNGNKAMLCQQVALL